MEHPTGWPDDMDTFDVPPDGPPATADWLEALPSTPVVHVHHHDLESHAESWSEGWDEAHRQGVGGAELREWVIQKMTPLLLGWTGDRSAVDDVVGDLADAVLSDADLTPDPQPGPASMPSMLRAWAHAADTDTLDDVRAVARLLDGAVDPDQCPADIRCIKTGADSHWGHVDLNGDMWYSPSAYPYPVQPLPLCPLSEAGQEQRWDDPQEFMDIYEQGPPLVEDLGPGYYRPWLVGYRSRRTP